MFANTFNFLGSIKFAVPLLSIIITILIGATFYESQVGSATVQHEIYKSAWFGALMFLLALNLGISALNRYPWRGARKVGFALTHLGLIVLIAGAAAVIHLSVEGMLPLRTDSGPNAQIRVEGDLLETIAADGTVQQTDVFVKPNGSVRPRSFAGLSLLGYSDNTIQTASFLPGAVVENPAVRLSLHSDRMGQTVERWLAAAPAGYQRLSLGPALLELIQLDKDMALEPLLSPPVEKPQGRWGIVRITSPAGKTLEIDVEQRLLKLAAAANPEDVSSPEETDSLREENAAANVGAPLQTDDSSVDSSVDLSVNSSVDDLQVKVVNFWPDFRLDENNLPITVSQQLKNPVVQLEVSSATSIERWFLLGRDDIPPVRAVVSGAALEGVEAKYAVEPQPSEDYFRVIVTADRQLFYAAHSSKGFTSGALAIGQSVSPGWADFQITLAELLPRAQLQRQVVPVSTPSAESLPALLVRTESGKQAWLPWGEPETIADPEAGEIFAGFSPKVLQLPFAIALEDFIIDRNEGTNSVAMWTSQIRIDDRERRLTTHRNVWMNHPTWYQGWKIAQASWNPNDVKESTLQVKREPTWVTALTWSGSILVVLGIGVMFYGPIVAKRFRRHRSPSSSTSTSLSNPEILQAEPAEADSIAVGSPRS